MTLREAEKEVLKAAVAWRAIEYGDPREAPLAIELNAAVAQYEAVKAAAKPRKYTYLAKAEKMLCTCGRRIARHGPALYSHKKPGTVGEWPENYHAPRLEELPTAQPRGGGNEEGMA